MHIRRLTVLMLVILTVLSSCIMYPDTLTHFLTHPNDSYEIYHAGPSEPGDFSFTVMTDMHFGRPKSYMPDESKTMALIRSFDPSIVFNLGDFADRSRMSEYRDTKEFNDRLLNEVPDTKVFMMLGNHDIKGPDMTPWDTYFTDQPYYQAFDYRGVSFYLMNNSSRTLGRTQLEELEKALNSDTNTKKIVLGHIPFHSIDSFGYFNMSDSREVNRILTSCYDSGVDLIITGHCHRDSEFTYHNGLTEHVCASYNGKDSPFETPPYIYNFVYSDANDEITLYAYRYDPEIEQWEPDPTYPRTYPVI